MKISFIQRTDGIYRLRIPKEYITVHKIEPKKLYNVTIEEMRQCDPEK
jgi:hypothetical protein